THAEHTDDPSRVKARRTRRNARSHDQAILSFVDIINDREFTPSQVALANYVLKARATRYIASARQSDLFPERIVGEPRWCEIDKEFYPAFPSFRTKTEMMISYKDDTLFTSNAFGEHVTVPGWFSDGG